MEFDIESLASVDIDLTHTLFLTIKYLEFEIESFGQCRYRPDIIKPVRKICMSTGRYPYFERWLWTEKFNSCWNAFNFKPSKFP